MKKSEAHLLKKLWFYLGVKAKRCFKKLYNLKAKNDKIRDGKVHESVVLEGIKCTYHGSNNKVDIA